jgi:predicted ATPase
LYDRSPICTLALARYAERPVTRELATEVDRLVRDQLYQPQVFFVDLLGFVTPTAARRITLAQSIRFAEFHREAYLAHGFELIEIPIGTVDERARLVAQHLRAWSDPHASASAARTSTATESPPAT